MYYIDEGNRTLGSKVDWAIKLRDRRILELEKERKELEDKLAPKDWMIKAALQERLIAHLIGIKLEYPALYEKLDL